jgi:hypothetical protein
MAEITNSHDPRDDAFLFHEATFCGKPLRHMSPVSYILLRKIGNPFVANVPMPDNHFAPATEWALAHTLTIPERNRRMADPEEWRAFVAVQMDLVPLAEVLKVLPCIRADMRAIDEASVEALPGKEGAA